MDHDRLLTKIATLYYKAGLTQQDIADRLGLSRQTTGRYLKEAEQCGIVRFEIQSDLLYATELEYQLEDIFGLKEAVVVAAPSDDEVAAKSAMGEAGAAFLERRVLPGDSIAVSWSSTLLQCAMQLRHLDVLDVSVVQMNGSLDRTTYSTRAEYLIERMAEAFNCQASSLVAPLSVDHASIRDSLLSDSRIAATLTQAVRASVALFGVGNISEQSSLYRAGYLDGKMLRRLRQEGAVGEICGRFFDSDGKICVPEYDKRTIAINLDALRSKRISAAIAGGLEKVEALQGALRGQYCNVLITTEATARALLPATPEPRIVHPTAKNTVPSRRVK